MMNRKILTLTLASSVIIIGGVLVSRTAGQKAEAKKSPSLLILEKGRSAEIERPKEREPAAAAVSVVKKPLGAPEPAIAKVKFEYQQQLDDFTFLKKKVLLSSEEKSERRDLLRNDEFLRGLGELLRAQKGSDFESEAQRNMALDALFEALSQEQSEAAAQALRSIVEDTAIENAAVDLGTRKMMAGVKAEVLFQWTSMDPARAGEISGWLPGPVSQKIWRNVVTTQQLNLAESAAEAEKEHLTLEPSQE